MEILKEIGFTDAEAKVYIALLEIGESKSGQVINKTGLQNSVFYRAVYKLIDKGFVSYIIRNRIKHFMASDPKMIKMYLKDLEKKVDDIPKSLKKEEEKVEIYEGKKGVMNMLSIMIEDVKKGEEYCFISPTVDEMEEIGTFYSNYDMKRKEKGLITRGIAPTKVKKYFAKRKYPKMKYVDYPIPQNMGICNDFVCILTWGDKPRGILIKSKVIAEKQKAFFDSMWK